MSNLSRPNIGGNGNRELLKSLLASQRQAVSGQAIAVIGISGRYPMSETLDMYWENLKKGKNCICEIPENRWDWREYYDSEVYSEGKSTSKWGGFIKDADKFDPLFFNISPREAEGIDPQERLFLETAWAALENAGYTRKEIEALSYKVGVFVGVMNSNYEMINAEALSRGLSSSAHCAFWSIANRVSYHLNLQGPSLSVDTACSSSLTAIHLACESLRRGECKAAIAGGVNLILHPEHYNRLSSMNVLAGDERCKTFGDGADGFVDGEGVGAVLLKPLANAISDGDRIYAVIKGSAINAGGKTSGYTVPNPNAQAEVVAQALKKAGVDPRTISFIEAHGTGTSLGDPIEVSGLTRAFKEYTHDKQFCSIGSSKSNIGHLESAAGVAALTKVILQMKYKLLVPSINSEKLNPKIYFEDTPFYVQHELAEWKQPLIEEDGVRKIYPRRAGISSFGAGGANAHLVLEEYESTVHVQSNNSGPRLFVLSAKNDGRLMEYARIIRDFLKNMKICSDKGFESRIDTKGDSFDNIMYTLQTGREAMDERLAIIAGNREELLEKLESFLNGNMRENCIFRSCVKDGEKELKLFQDNKEFKNIIDTWLKEECLNKLAEIWVRGADIDWKLLAHNSNCTKVSLSTYPFARERFSAFKESIQEAYKPGEGLHPLLGKVNVRSSTGKGVVFHKQLKNTRLILADHKVNEQSVFPGVGYVELALAALAQISDEKAYKLSNLVLLQPMSITEPNKDIGTFIEEDGESFKFEIWSSKDGHKVVHAVGEFHPAQPDTQNDSIRLNVEEIKARCAAVYDKATIYERFKGMGITYGPYFTGLQQIWASSEEILGFLSIPEEYEKELNSYFFHPTIADGALQAVLGYSILKQEDKSCPLLPFSIDELERIQPFKGKGYTYIKPAGKNRFNVAIMDETGLVCVKLHGISFRELKNPVDGMFFQPQWVPDMTPYKCNSIEHFKNKYKNIVILYTRQSVEIADKLAECHSGFEVYRICLGFQAIKHSEYDREIDVSDSYSILNCIQSIKNIEIIYYLGGIENRNIDTGNFEELEKSQETGVISLFRLVKALDGLGLDHRPIALKVVTNNVHPITSREIIKPYSASLHGLTGAIAKEYQCWEVSCIDVSMENVGVSLSDKEANKLAEAILVEPADNNGDNVAIREGIRYRMSVNPIGLVHKGQTLFKKQGVYLILGGAGGLGLALSLYLSETFQAKLVLVGRSELKDEQKEKIAHIQSKGGSVLYLQGNAADLDSMREVVGKAKREFGEINGVIHSAIVLKDKTIRNMDEETLSSALDPKVKGTVALYEAVKEEELDFMLFFSSAQSFIAAAGQGNYAAGCSFKDVFAHYIGQKAVFPVRIINWGYWGNAGIVASEEYGKRLAQQGIYSISASEGMYAVNRILENHLEQVIAIKAEKSFFEKRGIKLGSKTEIYPVNSDSILTDVIGQVKRPDIEYTTFKEWMQSIDAMERFCSRLLLAVFQNMGVFRQNEEIYLKDQLMKHLDIAPEYTRLIDALLDILERAGFIYVQERQSKILTTLEAEKTASSNTLTVLQNEMQELLLQYPENEAYYNLLWRCMEAYPDVLSGKKGHMEVLFPDGSKSLVERIYKGNGIIDYYNRLVAELVVAYVRERLKNNPAEEIKILEAGAGTGGTSKFVLEALNEYGQKIKYYYTDISVGFINHGKMNFGSKYHFTEFRVFNLENQPEEQGFNPNSIDFIFGSNVFHATKRLDGTVSHLKKLLKANGILALNETTGIRDFSTITFGLTDGWWLFEDEYYRIKGSPLLSKDMWKTILETNGFRKINILSLDGSEGEDLGQNIIVAESDGTVSMSETVDLESVKECKDVATDIEKEAFGKQNLTNTVHSGDSTDGNMSQETVAEKVMEYVRDIFSEVLHIRKNEIDIQSTFEKYGVDSLIVLELNKALGRNFGKLPATLLFEHNTIELLSKYFINNYPQKIEELPEMKKSSRASSTVQLFENSTSLKTQNSNTVNSKEISGNPVKECALNKIDSETCANVHDIAIIGLDGKYPLAETLEEFWENIKIGRNCITEIPKERWDWKQYFDVDFNQMGKSYSKWGGFIKDVDKFDPLFFHMTPQEAEEIDPQERLFLETVWAVFEDAGITRKTLTKSKEVGVFVGSMNFDYARLGGRCEYWSIANRISYFFNFCGPSITVDSACSSSLTALHLACESLKRGECKLAIAGGVSLILHPVHYSNMSRMNMLSRDNKCKPFGKGADGFVDGEGVGAVLLKPLENAVADGDRIYAVIKGSSINAGGKTSGYTVPNPNAQAELIKKALSYSSIDSATISYVEAHGTGTSLGDPIEIAGLCKAFAAERQERQYCSIGSVKSNIGHLESAAGIAGLTKVLLQMKHKQLVPSINSEELNTHIEYEQTPFHVQHKLEEWKQPVYIENGTKKNYPRRAGISSFGAGGANAHLVVEEYESSVSSKPEYIWKYRIVPVSAKDEDRLKEYAYKLINYLEADAASSNGTESIGIDDIAYTLQVGREEMEERLALVVDDKLDLVRKLRDFCEGGKDIKGLYRGCSKNTGSGKARALVDEYVKAYSKEQLETKGVEELARQWSTGVEFDWEILYGRGCPKKVSLPTYPFARERYWISEQVSLAEGETDKKIERLHLLIDRNTSDFKEQKFSTLLTGKEFYMTDHVLDGQMVLPGAAFIEMARAAGEIAGMDRVSKIKDVRWLSLARFGKHENSGGMEVKISLHPGSGFVECELWRQNHNSGKEIYAVCKLAYGEDKEKHEYNSVDIGSVINRCSSVKTGNECYQLFQKNGLSYGPGFQTLKEIFSGENVAIARLELPEFLRSEPHGCMYHPSLLDGSLQAVIGLMTGDEKQYVPVGMESIELINPLSEICYVYIVRSTGLKDYADLQQYDITITDQYGNIQVRIRNFSVNRLSELPKQETDMEHFTKNLLYSYDWEERKLSSGALSVSILDREHLLVFYSENKPLEFSESMPSGEIEHQIITVKPGEYFRQLSRGAYEIAPDSEDDYKRLISTLKSNGINPAKIIHVLGCEDFKGSVEESIKYKLERTFYSIFYLTRALISQKTEGSIRLLAVYPYSDNISQPYFVALSALFKTIRQENPRFIFKTVEFDSKSSDLTSALNAALCEFQSEAGPEFEIRYENGKRMVKTLKLIETGNVISTELPLKEKGVYLITGGAGGLGLVFAKYLASRFKAKLVLAGRSELSDEKKGQIKQLEDLGAEIVYLQADISKPDDVNMLISKTKSVFGKLNGIIHSAGVIHDALLLNKNPDIIQEVIAPKIYGTVLLDEATQNDNLDFMILFSSVSAVTGNIGQADYAYANSFMDNFAHVRELLKEKKLRSGKTVSICWPLWQDGGMKVDRQIEERFKKATGMSALSTWHGIDAFERSLLCRYPQVAVFHGNTKNAGVILPYAAKQTPGGRLIKDIKDCTCSGLREKMEAYLKNILSKEIKLPVERIKSQEPLENYGINSLIVMNLTREMEKYFGELSKTLFYEYQSIAEIASYFADNHGMKLEEKFGVVQPDNRKQSPATLENRCTNVSQTRFMNLYAPKAEEKNKPVEEIAIIGVSGRYPMADNLDEFWENLKSGRDCITEIPDSRWNYREFYDPERNKLGKSSSKWGGFINDMDNFDPLFFNISPKEAGFLDPQERLFLETAWHTVEDAGYTKETLAGGNVGVFVGVMYGQYQLFGAEENIKGNYVTPGSSYASIPNRVSYYFNFRGPSIALDTMCSSSLTAIHLACTSIRNGECEAAIAGGVNITCHPYKYLQLGMGNFTSSDGRCRSFGEGGDGYVPGEGVGAVLLKPLERAIEDDDYIYAIIKGSSINHGGKTNGYTVPNPNAQAELITDALRRSGADPVGISYIEAHGTGTSLGDPIEITGLTKAFHKYTNEAQYCSIGSVKSNIGHLESAAGIAGITKILLQMKYKMLVPSIHSEKLNPNINFTGTPFYVQRNLMEWKQPVIRVNGEKRKFPRIAGVSSFGAGGANAHIILEEYEDNAYAGNIQEAGTQIIVLSARNEDRLKVYARKMADFLQQESCGIIDKGLQEQLLLELLIQDLLKIVSTVMNVKETDIIIDENLENYGLDHVGLMRIAEEVNKKFEIDIEYGAFIEGTTIELLSRNLLKGFYDKLMCYYRKGEAVVCESDNNSKITLADIAFTLQLGRMAMDERMALVVSSTEQLKERLIQFSGDESNIEGLYRGNAKKAQAMLNLFQEDEDIKEIIPKWIEKGKLHRLAELWVNGADIDWSIIYKNEKRRRISLPVYPFSKQRCWFESVHGERPVHAAHIHTRTNRINIQTDASQGIIKDCLNNMIFVPKWKPASLTQSEVSNKAADGNILVIYTEQGIRLKDSLTEFYTGDIVYEIQLGRESSYCSEYKRKVSARDCEALDKCIRDFNNVNTVYFLSGIYTNEIDLHDIKALEQSQEEGIISLFRLVKSLSRHGFGQKTLKLKVVTNNVCQVMQEDGIRPFSASLHGLTKVIAKEYINWEVCCIDLSLNTADLSINGEEMRTLARAIILENAANNGEEVVLRNGKRYIRTFDSAELPHQVGNPFKEHGVYLILGGVGGIGLELSRYLAETVHARLVLIGRSQLNDKQKDKISDIESRGGKVLYIQSDATKYESIKAAISSAKEHFGEINGVIHSAIVLKDKTIENMDEESLRLVLGPKINGSVALYNALEGEKLDFMMFFSSAQSLAGNAGQGNYAAGCAFKDAFAKYLDYHLNYPVKTVNWGYWGSVGVASSDEFNKRMAAQGIYSIEPYEGMEAVRRILAQPLNQVMVTKMHNRILESMGITLKKQDLGAKDPRLHIENKILECLVSILQINRQELDIDTPYTEFGVDSVLAIRIVDMINKELGINLKPTDLYTYSTVSKLTENILKENEKINIKSVYPDEASTANSDEIAVIGIAARLPDAENVDKFWDNLKSGKNSVKEITRWDENVLRNFGLQSNQESCSNWGGFLEDIDAFDPFFLNISVKEAESMDPQQRLLLMESWKAFEDAGYSSKDLDGKKCGVFIGAGTGDYKSILTKNNTPQDIYSYMGNDEAFLPARISYLLNLKGACLSVNTACSSSLVAVHLACESIRRGESELALAGGVTVINTPGFFLVGRNGGMLSPDGQCKTFDWNANGFAPGEGVGLVVLKALKSAVRDGDQIYGVICGSGINQDGKTNGITAPNVLAQTELEYEVYSRYNIDPGTIGYVEAHGTGTKLGDPIEISALTNAFKKYTEKKQYCAIGSVKTNIGHGLSVAGVSGLIKTLLCIKYKKLVPSLNFENENEYINFKDSPFYVNTEYKEWESLKGLPRQAAVSSFGLSGTNAHIVLKEYENKTEIALRKNPDSYCIIPISAKTRESLEQKLEDLAGWLKKNEEECDIRDISYTLMSGRSHFTIRSAIVAADTESLLDKIRAVQKGSEVEGYLTNSGRVEVLEQTAELKEYGENLINEIAEGKLKGSELKSKVLELAGLYVQGYQFNWKALYAKGSFRRISLPTYPFSKGRYWAASRNTGLDTKCDINEKRESSFDLAKLNQNEENPISSCGQKNMNGYKELGEKGSGVGIFYKTIWCDAPLKQGRPEDLEPVIIFDRYEGVFNEFIAANIRVILVKPANEYGELSENMYTINPAEYKDYCRLFNSISDKGVNVRNIVHLWNFSDISLDMLKQKNLDKSLSAGVYSVFHICKELSKLKLQSKLKLLYVSQESCDNIQPYNSAVSGLIKSIRLENRYLHCCTLRIDDPGISSRGLFNIAVNELRIDDSVDVKYENSKRKVEKVVESDTFLNNTIELKKRGVYLITGGCGGLGLIFARHLSEKYNARLILLGRSELNEEKKGRIKEIESFGGKVRYISADISNYEEAVEAINEVKKEFKEINGVIHAAGIVRDSFITRKDIESFREVISPKIKGTLVLDEVMKSEKLDFFVMFSSTSSILGNIGHCDYAAGNGFMDSFAAYRNKLVTQNRRTGMTIAINWPLWKDGGMRVDKALEKIVAENTGILPLESDIGILAFEAALLSNEEQLIILHGDRKRIRKLLGIDTEILSKKPLPL